MKTCYDIVHTPWGELSIVCNAQALLWAGFDFQPPEGCEPVLSPLLQAAKLQLEEYLAGRRRFFSLPLAPNGTPFQHAVWNALLRIPYGETRTYKPTMPIRIAAAEEYTRDVSIKFDDNNNLVEIKYSVEFEVIGNVFTLDTTITVSDHGTTTLD